MPHSRVDVDHAPRRDAIAAISVNIVE